MEPIQDLQTWIQTLERSLGESKTSYHQMVSTVEPRFTGPRFAGEPRFTGEKPADQTFHYISLFQKPRFTGQKTPILGIFSKKTLGKCHGF